MSCLEDNELLHPPLGPPPGALEIPGCAARSSAEVPDIACNAQGKRNVIGIDYFDSGFSGRSHVWFTRGEGCGQGRQFAVPFLADDENDEYGSAQGYNGCNRFKHFEHSHYQGALLRCTPNCYSMGALDDETSSMKWQHQ